MATINELEIMMISKAELLDTLADMTLQPVSEQSRIAAQERLNRYANENAPSSANLEFMEDAYRVFNRESLKTRARILAAVAHRYGLPAPRRTLPYLSMADRKVVMGWQRWVQEDPQLQPVCLATLSQRTPFEVLAHVAEHLLRQNASSMDEDGLCMYRGLNGLKCAAGALMANSEYKKKMESLDWEQLAATEMVPPTHSELIMFLQEIHDSMEPEHWRRALQSAVKTFDIHPTPSCLLA